MVRHARPLASVLILLLGAQIAAADPSDPPENGIGLGPESVQHLRVGIRVTAGGPAKGIHASVPIPMDWPEQKVRIVDEDISRNVSKVDYRVLEDSVKQMVVWIARLREGEKAHAILTLEVKGRAIEAPKDPSRFSIPKKTPRPMRKLLAASPQIESRNRKILDAAKTAAKDKELAWEKVEAIYEYVRQNVQYRESELAGAVKTLQLGTGDCEGMTSLFVAMCRGIKVPSRVVWVTDHCYPEFFLEDEQGNGHWIPCQVAGSPAFGGMPDVRPIFQKGDNIRVPEKKKGQRYASLFLKAKAVRGKTPRVEEIVEFVPVK